MALLNSEFRIQFGIRARIPNSRFSLLNSVNWELYL
jgi:hypothetical protein